jgi:Pentapeptide repeats (8 copies)
VIVTFYSYKGGVGRSMAMVNVGEILADIGYDVTLCDFDLEAPGLERYMSDKPDVVRRLRACRGVVDLLEEYKNLLASPAEPDAAPRGEAADFRDMNGLLLRRPSSCATLIPSSNPQQRLGRLRYLGAGRREGSYAGPYSESVRQFNWSDFYDRWAGAAYLDFFREDLTAGRSIVLVDSRTGVTEHGGVCTHHLADLVVLVSAPNDVNIEGTKWMANLLATADLADLRQNRPLQVMPVAGRVETGAQVEELKEFRNRFEEEFSASVPAAAGNGRNFIQTTEIPYIPYYAFTEKVVARETGTRYRELYSAYAALARAIVAVGLDGDLLATPLRPGWAPASQAEQAEQALGGILDRHRRWLATGHREGERAVLRGWDFSRQEFAGVDLSDADLTDARCVQTDLRDARLTGAELSGAVLRGARLDRAVLSGANLHAADLTNAVLTGAALDFCVLTEANLEAADAAGAVWRGAALNGARLNRANLFGCDLRESDLTDAVLLGTDLRSANLFEAVGLDRHETDQAIVDGETRLPASLLSKSARPSRSSWTEEIVPSSGRREHPALSEDFRFLDNRLVPRFQQFSLEAASLSRIISRWHAVVISCMAIGVVFTGGAAGALFLGGPGHDAWFGLAAALLAVIAGMSLLSPWYRLLSDRLVSARRAGDQLQSEFFLFLGHIGAYADPSERRRILTSRVGSIVSEAVG